MQLLEDHKSTSYHKTDYVRKFHDNPESDSNHVTVGWIREGSPEGGNLAKLSGPQGITGKAGQSHSTTGLDSFDIL